MSNSIILYRILKIYSTVLESFRESKVIKGSKDALKKISDRVKKSVILYFIFEKVSNVGFLNTEKDIYLGKISQGGLRDKLREILKKSLIITALSRSNLDYFALVIMAILFPFLPSSLLIFGSIFTLIIAFIKNIMTEKKDRKYKLYNIIYFLFLISICLASILNLNVSSTIPVFITYMSFALIGMIVPNILNNRKKVLAVVYGMLITVLLVSIYGMYQKVVGVAVDPAWLDEKYGEDVVRIFSVFGNPNVFGEYLVMTMPLVFVVFDISKKVIGKLIALGILGIAGVNLLSTMSRGSIISFIIAMTLLILIRLRKYIPLLIIGGLASPLFLPKSIMDRILSSFVVKAEENTKVDSSISYRAYIYKTSLDMFKERPVTGFGLGQFKDMYKMYSLSKAFHAHNLYLMVAIEGGILMVISFAYTCLLWVKTAFSKLYRKKDNMITIAIAIIVGIIGVSIQGVTDYIWHNYGIMFYYFFMIGLAYASCNIKGESVNE